jgi:hypothetical protein
MKRDLFVLCLATLLILLLIIPAGAIPLPPYVVDSGVSRNDRSSSALMERKDTWTFQDWNLVKDDQDFFNPIAVWYTILPGSDVIKYQRGTNNEVIYCQPDQKDCLTNWYSWQSRVFTPDGKDWWKDYGSINNNRYGIGTYDNGQGAMIPLHSPQNFRKSIIGSTIPNSNDIGGPVLSPMTLKELAVTSGTPYEWRGLWKVELYLYDPLERHSTLLKTQYFTLVDGTTAVTITTTPTASIPVSATTTPTSTLTTSPYNVPVSPITSPTAPGTAREIVIEAEDITNANVKKTGASWDSVVEKCPTWRGSDWSGTGDYFLSNGGDALTYSFNVPASGTYALWMRDWSDTNHAPGDRQVTIAVDNRDIGTFDAASSFSKGTTGYGWDRFDSVPLSAGPHSLKITKEATTSSAAIIDAILFTTDKNANPPGSTTHSEALCAGKTGTTPSYSPNPTGSGIETALIPLAIGLGAIAFMTKKG